MTQIQRAKHIKRTLGIRYAARFLQRRGWCVEAAVLILCRGR